MRMHTRREDEAHNIVTAIRVWLMSCDFAPHTVVSVLRHVGAEFPNLKREVELQIRRELPNVGGWQ